MEKNFELVLAKVLAVAKEASQAILEVFANKNYNTQHKADKSPVTEADLKAHHIIVEGLSKIRLNKTEDIPVLSEEGQEIPYLIRKHWTKLWLVDPLDGTKEFIQGSEDFTINIALIEDHQPVLGVVVAPVPQHYYWATKGGDAYFQEGNHPPIKINVRQDLQDSIKVAVSRSHSNDKNKWEALIKKFKDVEFIYRGSALKICLVARGVVDLYPRLGQTGEWDTAAGQCILEAAGGKLVDLWGRPFKYNARETLVNEGFFALGSVELLSYIVDKSI